MAGVANREAHLQIGRRFAAQERVAVRLRVHQSRERRGALRLAAKRVHHQLPEMLPRERREPDLGDLAPGGPDGVEPAHQRMGGIDLVVPIGADQQEVPQVVRSGQQILEQVERRRIQPLQIVETQGQRMLSPREYGDESAEHPLEAVLGILRWNFRNWWLLSDNELQFRNQVHNQLSILV